MILEYKLLLSLGIILVFMALKIGLVKLIRRRAKSSKEDKRYRVNLVKNISNFTVVIIIISLWATEMQNFALSLAAFAVAIVLATKEFIQCITGFLYLGSNRIFRAGDWIQVGDHMGEVTENDWLKISMLEIDASSYDYTGRSLVLPNSMMLTNPVKNLNFLKRYATHSFDLVRDGSVDVFAFRDQIEAKAREHCEHFKDVANRYNNLIEKRLEVPIPGPDPTVRITTSYLGLTYTSITIFCPTEQAVEIEQKITRDFMQLWFAAQRRQQAEYDSVTE